MEPVTVMIGNELEAISILHAVGNSFLRAHDADDDFIYKIDLLIEEVACNIIQYAHPHGQKERIDFTFSIAEGMLEVFIRYKGVPFDVASLEGAARLDNERILESGGRGLGLRLVNLISDEVQYRNLGWEGQQICLRKSLRGRNEDASLADSSSVPETASQPLDLSIRRARTDESASISMLAYLSYGYTYFNEYIYDPEQIRMRIGDGSLICCLAINNENEEIIGHAAMAPDYLSGMPELVSAFVHPKYRGKNCIKALTAHLIDEAREMKFEGVFNTAVTSHPYTQSASIRFGMKESALFVSRLLPMSFRHITGKISTRQSLMYMAKPFNPQQHRTYHAPGHHRRMMEHICHNIGVKAYFAEDPRNITLPEYGETRAVPDKNQTNHVIIAAYGKDTTSQVRTILRNSCLDRLETIYLYLPLFHPSTGSDCTMFEDMGFFFSGLKLGKGGNDWLVLQYLNNQRYDYDSIKTYSPFARELLDYVRSSDPAGSLPG